MSAEHGNCHHVVVGPSGVYLLDTKTRTGLVRVEGDIVVVDQPDDPRASYRLDRVAAGQRAEAARLKADLELAATLGSLTNFAKFAASLTT